MSDGRHTHLGRNAFQVLEDGRASALYGPIYFVDPLRQVASVGSQDGFHAELPLLGNVGRYGEGDFSTPSPGWRGVITGRLGPVAIDAFVPGQAIPVAGRRPEQDQETGALNTWLALTGTPKLYRTLIGENNYSFRSNRPTDLIAGDQGFRSAEGATIAALRGGVALVKASDLCQFILNQVDDYARLLGRNLEIFTDWGSISLLNERGSTSLLLRGSREGKRTHAGNHDFECRIGGGGDSFVSAKIYDRTGAAGGVVVMGLNCDQRGKLSLWLNSDQVVNIAGDQLETIVGSRRHTVAGTDTQTIGESQTIMVKGNHDLSALESIETHAGRKVIEAKTVELGGTDGEPAVMGQQLLSYLNELVSYINVRMQVLLPNGVSLPGTSPEVKFKPPPDDLLSRVVYCKGEKSSSPAPIPMPAPAKESLLLTPTVSPDTNFWQLRLAPAAVLSLLLNIWVVQSVLVHAQCFPYYDRSNTPEAKLARIRIRRPAKELIGLKHDPTVTAEVRDLAHRANAELRRLKCAFRLTTDIDVFLVDTPDARQAVTATTDRYIILNDHTLKASTPNKRLQIMVHELIHASMSYVLARRLSRTELKSGLINQGLGPHRSYAYATESVTEYLAVMLTGKLTQQAPEAVIAGQLQAVYNPWPAKTYNDDYLKLVGNLLGASTVNADAMKQEVAATLRELGVAPQAWFDTVKPEHYLRAGLLDEDVWLMQWREPRPNEELRPEFLPVVLPDEMIVGQTPIPGSAMIDEVGTFVRVAPEIPVFGEITEQLAIPDGLPRLPATDIVRVNQYNEQILGELAARAENNYLNGSEVLPSSVLRLLVGVWTIQSELTYAQSFPEDEIALLSGAEKIQKIRNANIWRITFEDESDYQKIFRHDDILTRGLIALARKLNGILASRSIDFRLPLDVDVFRYRYTAKQVSDGIPTRIGETWIPKRYMILYDQRYDPLDAGEKLQTLLHELLHCAMSAVLTDYLYDVKTRNRLKIGKKAIELAEPDRLHESLTEYLSFMCYCLLLDLSPEQELTRRATGYISWPLAFYTYKWLTDIFMLLTTSTSNRTTTKRKLFDVLKKWNGSESWFTAARFLIPHEGRIERLWGHHLVYLARNPDDGGLIPVPGPMAIESDGRYVKQRPYDGRLVEIPVEMAYGLPELPLDDMMRIDAGNEQLFAALSREEST